MFKMIIAGITLVFTLISGYFGYQHQQKKLYTESGQLQLCRTVNESNEKIIQKLREENKVLIAKYEKKLKEKDLLYKKLQEIDNGGKDEKAHKGTVNSESTFLIDKLNGMYITSNPNGVCSAAKSDSNSGNTGILSSQVLYCFCSEEDVKNMLKNYELDKAYIKSLKDSVK